MGAEKKYVGHILNYVGHILNYVGHILKYKAHIFTPPKTRLKTVVKTQTNTARNICVPRAVLKNN